MRSVRGFHPWHPMDPTDLYWGYFMVSTIVRAIPARIADRAASNCHVIGALGIGGHIQMQ